MTSILLAFQLSGATMHVISRLLIVWKFMLMNDRLFVESYRVAITKEREYGPFGVNYPKTLCFWCLNPKVPRTGLLW